MLNHCAQLGSSYVFDTLEALQHTTSRQLNTFLTTVYVVHIHIIFFVYLADNDKIVLLGKMKQIRTIHKSRLFNELSISIINQLIPTNLNVATTTNSYANGKTILTE